jgi:hypothetical protein
MKGRKAFFFEKKKQKTFIPSAQPYQHSASRKKSFFGSFFSKKEHP